MNENIKLTSEEQETILSKDKASPFGNIYSSWPPEMKKLRKFCKEYPNDYILLNDDGISVEVKVLKKHITFKKPHVGGLKEEENEED